MRNHREFSPNKIAWWVVGVLVLDVVVNNTAGLFKGEAAWRAASAVLLVVAALLTSPRGLLNREAFGSTRWAFILACVMIAGFIASSVWLAQSSKGVWIFVPPFFLWVAAALVSSHSLRPGIGLTASLIGLSLILLGISVFAIVLEKDHFSSAGGHRIFLIPVALASVLAGGSVLAGTGLSFTIFLGLLTVSLLTSAMDAIHHGLGILGCSLFAMAGPGVLLLLLAGQEMLPSGPDKPFWNVLDRIALVLAFLAWPVLLAALGGGVVAGLVAIIDGEHFFGFAAILATTGSGALAFFLALPYAINGNNAARGHELMGICLFAVCNAFPLALIALGVGLLQNSSGSGGVSAIFVGGAWIGGTYLTLLGAKAVFARWLAKAGEWLSERRG